MFTSFYCQLEPFRGVRTDRLLVLVRCLPFSVDCYLSKHSWSTNCELDLNRRVRQESGQSFQLLNRRVKNLTIRFYLTTSFITGWNSSFIIKRYGYGNWSTSVGFHLNGLFQVWFSSATCVSCLSSTTVAHLRIFVYLATKLRISWFVRLSSWRYSMLVASINALPSGSGVCLNITPSADLCRLSQCLLVCRTISQTVLSHVCVQSVNNIVTTT